MQSEYVVLLETAGSFFCVDTPNWPTYLLSVPGPFGERDDQQVFIQKLVPDTDHVIVRFSSTGKR